jgi:hypothetical protein
LLKVKKSFAALLTCAIFLSLLFPVTAAYAADDGLPTVFFANDNPDKYSGISLYLGQNAAYAFLTAPSQYEFTREGENLVRIENTVPDFGGVLGFAVSSGSDNSVRIALTNVPASATTIVVGSVSTIANNKIQYYEMASGKVCLRYTCDVNDPDITVHWYFEPEQPNDFTITKAPCENGDFITAQTINANEYKLYATPANNCMLDYWECVSGSGSYGDGTEFNATDKKIIDVPDDYRYSNDLIVTLAESSEFKAYFKSAKLILLDGFGIYAGEQYFAVEYDNGTVREVVRAGENAVLSFHFRTPSMLLAYTSEGVKIGVALYKGDSTNTDDLFFGGTYSNSVINAPAPGWLGFGTRILNIPAMDGFTVSVTVNGGEASTRYYPLGDLILDDPLENERSAAITALDRVLEYCETFTNYASVKRQIGIVYDKACEAVKTAETAPAIAAIANMAAGQLLSFVSGNAYPGVITVAASVDKLTVSGDYIVEPVLLRLPEGVTAADALLALLDAKYPDKDAPYKYIGTAGTFYLQGVWDPTYVYSGSGSAKFEGYLSEFDEGGFSGWMISVNNIFPGYSAGAHIMKDGDVMRWQYTSNDVGGDIGGGGGAGGDAGTIRANKDALTRKVAELNKAGTTSGDKYAAAMTALKKLDAAQTEVDAALAAFYPEDNSGLFVVGGYGGTVALADESGHYVVTAVAAGYVIKDIWVDGAVIPEARGKTSYTTKAAPARSIFASFIYSPGG